MSYLPDNININNYRFLVTGGAGFIGHHIVNYLLDNNAGFVRVIDNLSTGFFRNIEKFIGKPNFEFVNCDLIDYNSCFEACKDIDIVFHQAALGSVPRSIEAPINTNLNNVNSHLNVLWACVNQNVKRIVYASSSSVYGDNKNLKKIENKIGKALSPYAVSKRTNELYSEVFFKQYNLEIIGLRYFNVFGPGQNAKGPYSAVIPLFIEALLNNKNPFIYGSGEQSRDFTYVENIVQANVKAAFTTNKNALGEVFNIGAGGNTTVNKLFEIIKSKMNLDLLPLHTSERKGDIKNSSASIIKAKKTLNYFPTVMIEEGIEKTISYFKETKNEFI